MSAGCTQFDSSELIAGGIEPVQVGWVEPVRVGEQVRPRRCSGVCAAAATGSVVGCTAAHRSSCRL